MKYNKKLSIEEAYNKFVEENEHLPENIVASNKLTRSEKIVLGRLVMIEQEQENQIAELEEVGYFHYSNEWLLKGIGKCMDERTMRRALTNLQNRYRVILKHSGGWKNEEGVLMANRYAVNWEAIDDFSDEKEYKLETVKRPVSTHFQGAMPTYKYYKYSKDSKGSKVSKDSQVSKGSKVSKDSQVSEGSKDSKGYKYSQVSEDSEGSINSFEIYKCFEDSEVSKEKVEVVEEVKPKENWNDVFERIRENSNVGVEADSSRLERYQEQLEYQQRKKAKVEAVPSFDVESVIKDIS